MTNPGKRHLSALSWALAFSAAILALPAASAQSVAAPAIAPTAAQLAKYDLNKNGRLDPDELAALRAAEATTKVDGVIQLSPFEVKGDEDQGYLATSTMSGTRMNSKLEDLAASISVVTKQQMLDTASSDINDLFMYESNTEGIYQWTAFGVDRGVVSDDVSGNPHGATRIRGLTSANFATNGFATTLPFDSYNVDAVEISRGPNSSLFGLGNTGGGVNLIGSRGSVATSSSRLVAQVDSYGGYRGTIDLNRPIIKGKVGFRLLGVYEDKGFERQPSADVTRRLQGAVTFRPFKNTTIRASFESYRNFNSRPNSTTPRDMHADWVSSGGPTWNPLTQIVSFRDGRAPIGPVTTALEATLLPYGIAATDTGFTGRPSWYIDNGRIELYTINRLPSATGTGPQEINGTARLLQNSTFLTKNSAAFPLYNIKGITNQSLYDWESVNLAAPNYANVRGETASADLEQTILRTERHSIALQASWLKEKTTTNSRAFLGYNDGGRMQVYIDINERLLDGTANPYFLRPYMGGSEPAFRKARANNENYRSTLAYELNLTRENNIFRHLGLQRFNGYSEYREIYGGSLGYKDTMSSTEAWMGTAANNTPASRNGASFRAYPRYYVGDATGSNIDYAPSRIDAPTNLTLRYLHGPSNTWINEPVEYSEYYYANRLNRRILSTYGGTWQGYFLDGRIIPTVGLRRDNNRTRDGNSAINPTVATNGYYDTSSMTLFGQNPWVGGKGKTETKGIVVKPLRWLHLSYNQSNAFSPGSLAYDVYGMPLSDPRGETKDYGFGLSLFPDARGNARLHITAKQYETVDFGRGSSSINTIVQRAIRLDADGAAGGDPDLEYFLQSELLKANPTWTTAQVDAEVIKRMGVDPSYIDGHRGRTHGDNSNSQSRGKEIEIIGNPTRHWRLKATVAQQKAFNGLLSPALQEYVASRIDTWKSIRSPFDNSAYWNGTYRVGLSPEQWFNQNVLAEMKLAIALQGKQRTQTREWRVNMTSTYELAGLTENKWLRNASVGGGLRWEDKGSIGFYGAAPDADGVVRSLDPDRPYFDKARTYVDLSLGYNLRFLNDKVRTRLQLNVKNVFEKGRLQPIAVNPDGAAWAFRIIDPRQVFLSATFDL